MRDWQEFEPEIARIAARLTPDEMLQEDLAQEMRIDIWRAPEGKPKATDRSEYPGDREDSEAA